MGFFSPHRIGRTVPHDEDSPGGTEAVRETVGIAGGCLLHTSPFSFLCDAVFGSALGIATQACCLRLSGGMPLPVAGQQRDDQAERDNSGHKRQRARRMDAEQNRSH